MMPLKQQAIETALHGNWEKAISLNQELLKENPDDIETLNRLAFAYAAIRKPKDAKTMYQKVLELDSQNPIALKNLRRLNTSDKNGQAHYAAIIDMSQLETMFVEETGKTKIIDLINIAPPQITSQLVTAEPLTLRVKRSKIFVLDGHNQYVGMLPDDLGKRLIKFLNGGNVYQSCVKSVNKHLVTIFMREIKRATRFKDQPSFISTDKQKPTKGKGQKSTETEE